MHELPPGAQVFERGWLSANNVLLTGGDGPAALVDSGYCTHAEQTIALTRAALAGRPLDLLVNTHLHSDHCGGNAALQALHADLKTWVPPGEAAAVAQWDEAALSYAATGQQCPRFRFDALLMPGTDIALGACRWQVHAAPGHDAHAVLLFEPASRTLLSADALWQNGFGVVFPELDGVHAFDDVAATLDLIAALDPALVVPGHGPVFTDVRAALVAARRRLDGFVREPLRHATHAAKVLVKFKLLEWQRQDSETLAQWVVATPLLRALHARHFSATSLRLWTDAVVVDLERAGAARIEAGTVYNA